MFLVYTNTHTQIRKYINVEKEYLKKHRKRKGHLRQDQALRSLPSITRKSFFFAFISKTHDLSLNKQWISSNRMLLYLETHFRKSPCFAFPETVMHSLCSISSLFGKYIRF